MKPRGLWRVYSSDVEALKFYGSNYPDRVDQHLSEYVTNCINAYPPSPLYLSNHSKHIKQYINYYDFS